MYYHHFDTLFHQTPKAKHPNQEATQTGELNRIERWLARIVQALCPQDMAVDDQQGDADLLSVEVDPVAYKMAYLTYDYLEDLHYF
jgi:hypothetical protein